MKLVRLSPVRPEQPWNIPARLVALLVLREERSVNVVKLEQFLNSPAMLTPLVVLAVKPVSVIDVRPVQSWNISDISVAPLASKPVRSNDVRPVQPSNIPDISVIYVVIIFAMLIAVNLSQPPNRPARDPDPRPTSPASEYQHILWRAVLYHSLTSPTVIGWSPTPGAPDCPKDSTVARFSSYNARTIVLKSSTSTADEFTFSKVT